MFKKFTKTSDTTITELEFKLLRDLLRLSYEEGSIAITSEKLIDVLQEHYAFEFVSIFLYSDEHFRLIASNNHKKYNAKLCSYVKSLHNDYQTPLYDIAKGGIMTYPTADLRDITGMYYHPLYINEHIYGAILIEEIESHKLVVVEGELFKLVINNLAFIIRNMQFTEKIKGLSETDSLTGTFNKRYMFDVLNEACVHGLKVHDTFSLGIFDIDHFKNFNDTYGHQHGDTVLQEVAACISECLSDNDMLFRFGGEEFVIYFKDKVLDDSFHIMEKIRLKIEALHIETPDTHERTYVTISGGISQFPLHATDYSSLFKASDHALYSAKDSGRNCILASDIVLN